MKEGKKKKEYSRGGGYQPRREEQRKEEEHKEESVRGFSTLRLFDPVREEADTNNTFGSGSSEFGLEHPIQQIFTNF
jgi:hypothetical protein